MATGTESAPCGACRFLRRKCTAECVFAPYFCSEEEGPARFAAIHKVFGASNVSKMLSRVPAHARREAILTVDFEAQSRIKDPVYGCVSHVLALQQQVEYLQDQVMQMEAKLAQNVIDDHSSTLTAENQQWPSTNNTGSSLPSFPNYTIDNCRDEQVSFQSCSKQRSYASHTDLSELHQLALRMMNNQN